MKILDQQCLSFFLVKNNEVENLEKKIKLKFKIRENCGENYFTSVNFFLGFSENVKYQNF